MNHGTNHAYANLGCRCEPCRLARREYVRTYRAQRRAAGRYTTHGLGSYTSGCRCETCRAANTAYNAQRRATRRDTGADVGPHGTTTAYRNGCRCDPCRAAAAAYQRAYRAERTLL